MKYFRVFLLLTLVTLCAGSDLELTIQGDPKLVVQAGTPVNLTCRVNKGLALILTHRLEWAHKSLAKETRLTSQQTLLDEASPNEYGIVVDYTEDYCSFTLSVRHARPNSDGNFTCKVVNQDTDDVLERDIKVIVVNNVESIAMKFDGEDLIMGEDQAGLQREEGEYGVTCTAKGFNPSATIHIFLDNEELHTGGTQIMRDEAASEKAGARRYTATARVTNMELKGSRSGQLLRCEARADFAEAETLVASVMLTVIALEPNITCDKNVNATLGQYYVKITCLVVHDKVGIDRYAWEIEDTEEIIVPHETNKNYHEVRVKEVDKDTTEVTLELYQVDVTHFDTSYFLVVVTETGDTFRERAELIQLESLNATKTAAGLLVCLLSVMLSIFSW